MKTALVIGGANGIGLAVALQLSKLCKDVLIVDRRRPEVSLPSNIRLLEIDLLTSDFDWLGNCESVDTLFYSAGFGRVAPFESLKDKEIENAFIVNTISVFKVLRYFISRIKSSEAFYCGIMVSIAGRIASPLFSVYSATKAALFRGIEAINAELKMSDSINRILEISPGSLKGTSFTGKPTNIETLKDIAKDIINRMHRHETLFIPDYSSVYKGIIERYNNNPEQFAEDSYNYKLEGNRLQFKPQLTIGYLSGTFDLFHIGHLNLLRRARKECDYLVVGVHKDASHKGKETFIPFDERVEILKNIKYVDKVIESEREDSDIYSKGIVKYDKLFVGSDYKGTERFNRYEEYFKDKGVQIIYFPYTQGTNSTQLRAVIKQA